MGTILREKNFSQIDLSDPKLNFSQLLEISSETLLLIQSIAWSELDHGEYKNAELIYSFLTLLSYNEPQYWFERGIANYYSGEKKAILYFEIALSLTCELPQIYLFLAAALLEAGARKEAKEAFLKGKELLRKEEKNWHKWAGLVREVEAKI